MHNVPANPNASTEPIDTGIGPIECEYSSAGLRLRFTDNDVVGIDEWIPAGEYNPHNVRPWLIYNEFGTVAVVFASHEQDALDAATDASMMECFQITNPLALIEFEAMGDDNPLAYLGNACEPHDLTHCGIVELPNPRASFCAQFAAHEEQ